MSLNLARIASTVAIALSSSAILAAVPTQNFQHGFYIGINTGASFVTGQTYGELARAPDFLTLANIELGGITLPSGFADTTIYRDEASARGYNGGLFIGWDFYCDKEYVYGVEVSGNIYSNRAHQTWWNIGLEGIINMQESWDLNYSADVVFKPGWFVSDSTKLYAILGLSVAGLDTELKNLAVNDAADPVSITDTKTLWGFVFGAGIQKQLCNNFSAFAAYEYTYYGHQDLREGIVESSEELLQRQVPIIRTGNAASLIQNRTFKIDTNVFKVGLIYTF